MGSLSDALEIELLDHFLKVGDFPVPANIYVALSRADPGETGAGIDEPTGVGSYVRTICNSWDPAASRATENTITITFPTATASWGTITHFALFDAITGGNFLAYGSLSEGKTINISDTAGFVSGAIDISFNAGGLSDYLANALLDHVCKTSPYTSPTNIYIALADEAVADGDSGTDLQAKEPFGVGSYARKNHNSWDAAANGASENNGLITFVVATAAWGTITHFALTDHLTAGNVLRHGSLNVPKAIGSNDTAEFENGGLDITLN